MPTNTLTPNMGPPFALPFGYDGSNFYGLRVDTVGVVVPALRVSLPWDRGGTVADVYWNGYVATHATTSRGAYTVPVDHFALLTHVYLDSIPVPGTGSARLTVTVRGKNTALLRVTPSTPVEGLTKTLPYAIPLLEGDVVEILSYNDSATKIYMYITCGILEFSK